MGFADVLPISIGWLSRGGAVGPPDVAVLEDDGDLATLAAEVCEGFGCTVVTYRAPGPFLTDFAERPPRVVVLDWRFENELGAGVFMAVRHRFGDVPIVCWTATQPQDLPRMVAADERTRVVGKERGVAALEAAVQWALASATPNSEPVTTKGAAS